MDRLQYVIPGTYVPYLVVDNKHPFLVPKIRVKNVNTFTYINE